MKRRNKIIFIILLLIITIIFFETMVYSFGISDLTGTQTEIETLKKTGNSIVKVVSTVGVVASVVMLIVLGIKYMIGSTDQKAEYKKSLFPYVIGAALVFAASSIAQIIYDIAIKL